MDPWEAGVLVELGLVEQRYRAVRDVLERCAVTDVARRNGVARQTVHAWLAVVRRRRAGGAGGPQLEAVVVSASDAAVVEARIVELRRAHPGWGPRTILDRLAKEG